VIELVSDTRGEPRGVLARLVRIARAPFAPSLTCDYTDIKPAVNRFHTVHLYYFNHK